MDKRPRYVLACGLVAFTALLATSCSNGHSIEERLKGTWKTEMDGEIAYAVFDKEKKLILRDTEEWGGNWQVVYDYSVLKTNGSYILNLTETFGRNEQLIETEIDFHGKDEFHLKETRTPDKSSKRKNKVIKYSRVGK